VSPTGGPGHGDTSCTHAAYSTIQAAVDVAAPGQTIDVCAGTYTTQVVIGTSNLIVTGAGASTVIDPTTATPATVADLDTSQTTVAIVDVAQGTTGVTLKNLAVSGSGLESSFDWPGCADNFAGVFYQAASGTVATVTVRTIDLPAGLRGCQDGIAVSVQSGTGGQAQVALRYDTVRTFDKGGIACNDAGTTCTVAHDTVAGAGPTAATAQNDVQIAFGASGSVNDNTLSGADWTGAGTPAEPQATFAAGVLLFGASGTTEVETNTLTGDQMGVELSDASGLVHGNKLTDTPGIAGAVGVFAVPCTIYCSYFTLNPGTVTVTVTHNTFTFGAPATGTDGMWMGDGAASATGSVKVAVSGNTVTGAQQDVVLGPTAYGSVSVGSPTPGPVAGPAAAAAGHGPVR
jgi:hypothetical protein